MTARVEALAEELRLTIVRTAEVEREAILLAIQRMGLTEPRQWLHRVETVRRELRGQGERIETRVFAGRAVEMAALDAWFDGGGSDRHLVVGRSGIGKSVLIQHWTDRKALDPAVTVLHVPLVSSPIDTADEQRALRYVCARLCALGEPPAMPLATATLDDLGDTLETLLEDLGGRQILIAIDGLDELTDPKDFVRCLPTSLPSGTKLLLSARAMAGGQDANAWIAQLGLADSPDQVTYLEPLGRRALREALAQAGHAPDGPTFEYLVSRVTQLTDGGDPLLFAFLSADADYLHSLGADPTDAEDTEAWRSGYRKLLERWIDDAARGMQAGGVGQDHRQMCFAALVAVAAAPAPPGNGELLQILRRRCDPRLLTMKGVLDPVRRWLAGDGRSGYRFSHPRLAEVVMTPHVLMDEPTLVHVESAFGEWFAEEAARGAAGATMPQYVASHALSYLLEHPSSAEDPVTRHVTGPMLRACRRRGLLLDAVGGVRKHLARDAWQGVGGITPSASVLVVRLLRLGLFLGSAPRGLTHGSAAVLARAVTMGALSPAEASAWALQGDDRQLFDHAYPEEPGWSQVHIDPEAYHLPVLYGALDEATRDELQQALSRRRDAGQISREGAEFPDEYWAWFGTLLLRMAAERPALCDDAEIYLASLPSWRAARCMCYVASLLPQRPDWLADMATRVRSATKLHAESGGINFDEEVAWLNLADESVGDQADRLLSLLDDWRTMTAWPMRTGSFFSPGRMRMRRLAKLTRHSAAAHEQGLALLASEHPFVSVEWAELGKVCINRGQVWLRPSA